MLTFRGGALYNYYHHYADKGAMFDFVAKLGLTTPDLAPTGSLADWLGYIIHGTRDANSNAADVFNSIINITGTATTLVFIILSSGLSAKYGRKTVAVVGFALSTVNALLFYFLSPTNTMGMFLLTITGSIVYAPTIAVA